MNSRDSQADVGAVVMAGGAGTRLGPLGVATPKCLLPLPNGQALLTRLLRQLVTAGIERITVCCSPANHAPIQRALDSCQAIDPPASAEIRAVACAHCSLGPIPAFEEVLAHVSGRWRLLCLGDVHFATEPFSAFWRQEDPVRTGDACLLTGTDLMARENSGSGAALCEGPVVRAISYRIPPAASATTLRQRRWSGSLFFRETLLADLRAHVAEYHHVQFEEWIQGTIERGAAWTWLEAGGFVNVNSAADYEFLTRGQLTVSS